MSEVTKVKLWLEAKNQLDLVNKMLVNNIINSCAFEYGDHLQKKNGNWYCCFKANLAEYKHPDKVELPKKPELDDML